VNIMLDLETLSTQPDAAVFEVALVPFGVEGPDLGDALHVLFVPETGHIDVSTVKWWLKHAEVCRLPDASMSERDAVNRIRSWLSQRSEYTLWGMPASFDCIILEQLLKRHGEHLYINFRQWRDVRTLREQAGWPETKPPEGHISHHALHDAVRQIHTVLACWEARTK
jgi:hypothetical protein